MYGGASLEGTGLPCLGLTAAKLGIHLDLLSISRSHI